MVADAQVRLLTKKMAEGKTIAAAAAAAGMSERIAYTWKQGGSRARRRSRGRGARDPTRSRRCGSVRPAERRWQRVDRPRRPWLAAAAVN